MSWAKFLAQFCHRYKECYKGKKYNLELWLGYDIADFETLENSYKAMKEVKKIIDDVIDGGNKDEWIDRSKKC